MTPRDRALDESTTHALHGILVDLQHGVRALEELDRDGDADHLTSIASDVERELKSRKTAGAKTARDGEKLRQWQEACEANADARESAKKRQARERIEFLRSRIAATKARIALLRQ